MKFSNVEAVRIPSGTAKKITHNGKILWQPYKMRYVSLGDSIAAGHSLDGWDESEQYGYGGNPNSTIVVPGCYTDLIHKDLVKMHGAVKTTSFARSGDTVADLMAKLDHDVVRGAIAKADIVTICIGANDVLEPAMSYLDQYINGDTSQMNAVITQNLARLDNDADANSYWSLFSKLHTINPNATYAFTAVYNPYKYLHLDESTSGNDYKDGFLGPLMWAVPDGLEIAGVSLTENIRSGLLNADAVKNLFNKVNELPTWAERYITSLNSVLRSKIAAFDKANFILADTKAVFDPVPDRTISAPKHYNDLVNVEITSGFNVDKVNWGEFWANYNWANVLDGIEAIANEAVNIIIDDVIGPDVDPHPEAYGQYALRCSFVDALGWETLPRRTVTYQPGAYGIGSMAAQVVVALDNMAAYTRLLSNAFTPSAEGYRIAGWLGNDGAEYSSNQLVGMTGDLTLTAQWSNLYTVVFRHSEDSSYAGSGDTGVQEKYALWIDGVEQADLGAFSNPPRVYNLPYGTSVGVIAQVSSGAGRSYITVNGEKVAGDSSDARWGLTVTSDMDIHFEWNYWIDTGSLLSPVQAYWNCYITTY